MVMMRDTVTPDIETSGETYARRFEGPIGDYFLQTQCAAVRRMLVAAGIRGGRVLDVGGGHGQLTAALMAMGLDVVVQGSAAACAQRLSGFQWQQRYGGFVASHLSQLPFADRSFDVVVGLRLMAHVERWPDLLREMARVSRRHLLIDYASVLSANALETWLFPVKRAIEGDARQYFCHSTAAVRDTLGRLGFAQFRLEKQFLVPMALHRGMCNRAVSEWVEGCCRRLGATRMFGSPVLLMAERVQYGRVAVAAQRGPAQSAGNEFHKAA